MFFFVLAFLKIFLIALRHLFPIIAILGLAIVLLAMYISRLEKWSRADALYYAFITATTVGYGDLHPTKRRSKLIAVLIALIGLLFTGLIVAIGVHAVGKAWTLKFERPPAGRMAPPRAPAPADDPVSSSGD